MKKLLPVFIILIVLAVALLSLKGRTTKPFEETFLYFDTFVKLTFYPEPGLDTKVIMDNVRKELERIDNLYGYGKTSLSDEFKKVRKSKITEEENYLLKKSQFVSNITGGAFDITIGTLEDVWGFRGNNPHVPQKVELEKALKKTGYSKILLDDSTVSLQHDSLIIDFGGISKGYAVDIIVDMLKKQGIKAGIVDAGGDLKVFGKKPDKEKWIIGIRHPERKGTVIKQFSVSETAVATSGNYERCFMENGKKYHHILDPKTGYPANRCLSVTIVSKQAILADALATGIFIMGPEDGMKLIETIPNLEGVIMYKEGGNFKILNSKGIFLRE